jgi:hypothetical protein
MAKDPKNLIFGDQWSYQMPDNSSLSLLQNILIDKQPHIMITIRNAQAVSVWRTCIKPQWAKGKAIYSARENISFYGNNVETGWIKLDINRSPNLANKVREANTIELEIVSKYECK